MSSSSCCCSLRCSQTHPLSSPMSVRSRACPIACHVPLKSTHVPLVSSCTHANDPMTIFSFFSRAATHTSPFAHSHSSTKVQVTRPPMLHTVLILVNNPTHTLAPSTLPDRYPAVLPELDTERSALVFRCGLECFSLLFEEEGGTVKFAGEMGSSLWLCDFECLQRHCVSAAWR
jgi:hypothetical protein